jgi:hypothetical protein
MWVAFCDLVDGPGRSFVGGWGGGLKRAESLHEKCILRFLNAQFIHFLYIICLFYRRHCLFNERHLFAINILK